MICRANSLSNQAFKQYASVETERLSLVGCTMDPKPAVSEVPPNRPSLAEVRCVQDGQFRYVCTELLSAEYQVDVHYDFSMCWCLLGAYEWWGYPPVPLPLSTFWAAMLPQNCSIDSRLAWPDIPDLRTLVKTLFQVGIATRPASPLSRVASYDMTIFLSRQKRARGP